MKIWNNNIVKGALSSFVKGGGASSIVFVTE